MNDWMDPQATAFIEFIRQSMDEMGPLDAQAVVTARANQGPAPGDELLARPMHQVRNLEIPGPVGPIACRAWIPRASEEPLPVVVYYTGAMFLYTELDHLPAGLLSMVAALGDCIVFVANHRKPPENKYPEMFDDATAAYRWVRDNAADLGGDPDRVAVMGESSGGLLAAVVCQDAKREGLRQPVLQVLLEPMLDLTSMTPSMLTLDFVLNKALRDWGASLNFDDEYPERVPRRASPLRAEDVAGLAPAYIVTAEFDPLRDEGYAYAMRLRLAGGQVTYLCYDGQVHGFMGYSSFFEQGLVANHQLAGVLRMVFASPQKD